MIKPATKSIINAAIQADDAITPEETRAIRMAMESAPARKVVLITSKEAATILTCTRRTLYNFCAKGKIHAIRQSARLVRFDKREIEALAYGMKQQSNQE